MLGICYRNDFVSSFLIFNHFIDRIGCFSCSCCFGCLAAWFWTFCFLNLEVWTRPSYMTVGFLGGCCTATWSRSDCCCRTIAIAIWSRSSARRKSRNPSSLLDLVFLVIFYVYDFVVADFFVFIADAFLMTDVSGGGRGGLGPTFLEPMLLQISSFFCIAVNRSGLVSFCRWRRGAREPVTCRSLSWIRHVGFLSFGGSHRVV